MNRAPMAQADGDAGPPERENLTSVEQDEAIRLLQRQVKALQDHIDNSLPSRVGMTVGHNWPK